MRYNLRKRTPIPEYQNHVPCGHPSCKHSCNENSLYCVVCCKRYHYKCMKISRKKYLEIFKKRFIHDFFCFCIFCTLLIIAILFIVYHLLFLQGFCGVNDFSVKSLPFFPSLCCVIFLSPTFTSNGIKYRKVKVKSDDAADKLGSVMYLLLIGWSENFVLG